MNSLADLIIKKSHNEARRIIKNAEKYSVSIKAKTKEETKEEEVELETILEQELEREELGARKTLEAEIKKEILKEQEEVVKEVFSKVMKKFDKINPKQYEKSLKNLLEESLQSMSEKSEIVCRDEDKKLIQKILRHLKPKVQTRIAKDKTDLHGVIVRSLDKKIIVDNTYLNRLDVMSKDLKLKVLKMLFGEGNV